MAYSFKRDLFELNHGEFHRRYGGPISEGDFAHLKAQATPRGRLLVCARETVTDAQVIITPVANKVITHFYARIFGPEATLSITFNQVEGAVIVPLSTNDASLAPEILLTDVEILVTSLGIAQGGLGTPIFYYALGYTPALTTP